MALSSEKDVTKSAQDDRVEDLLGSLRDETGVKTSDEEAKLQTQDIKKAKELEQLQRE